MMTSPATDFLLKSPQSFSNYEFPSAFREYLSRRKDARDIVTPDTVDHFVVTTLSSAGAWMKNTSGTAPDICLLEVSMDGDDEAGFKLASLVRKRLPLSVIVMFLGYDDVDADLRFIAAGASGFISTKTDMADVPAEVTQIY